MKKSNFIFNFDSEKEAKIIYETLKPEIKNNIPKTKINSYIEKNRIFLEINAEDVSSLRAACNSYLRWIDTALKVEKIL